MADRGGRPRNQPEAQSRKERFKKFDEEPKFSVGEKAAYFTKYGAPIVGAIVAVILLIVFLVHGVLSNIKPDAAGAESETEALQVLREAAAAERGGDDVLAAERLRHILRRFPGTTAAKSAEMALHKHENGERMFPRGVVERGNSAGEAGDVSAAQVAVVGKPEERGTAGTAIGKKPGTRVDPSGNAELDPEQARKRDLDVALAAKSIVKTADNVSARTPPEGFIMKPDSGIHASGWPLTIVCLKDGSEMNLVPIGALVMGRNDGPKNEQPAHEVLIGAFYMDRLEVRWEQYQKFLAAAASPSSVTTDARAAMKTAKHPAVGVTFADAMAYCHWAGKQLPTEAQWERAARGPTATLFPWGDDPGMLPTARRFRNIEPTPNYQVDRSAYGIFDLAGNAAEWCMDWYLESAYESASSQDPIVTGEPPTDARERVIRGGAADGTVTWRGSFAETKSAPWLGFRGILPIEMALEPAVDAEIKARRGSKSDSRRASHSTTINPVGGQRIGTSTQSERGAKVSGDRTPSGNRTGEGGARRDSGATHPKEKAKKADREDTKSKPRDTRD